ncbi:alpha/beta hydrolase [Sulfitobacter sp. M57]|uniref:ABC-three component system protein n=1 Tax=unclassified Sulfitobacter TaxID=196795 RepID=UPI0023E31180|nr:MULTISPECIES: ABC-three component system protein [unclassified Sulfitobacter]MDF3416345.1 alpha/beta hydrolase [Sulfitobacter sp. KE5]MDF3423824.1 alpha/beta hydrolase [Sulfitobacter sp. KE43]MDF3434891.1 alpha/beta hydrolase [Sulfitobacter sp. KE42]MDF3460530.1 alpha/beta hydrolase [Sulfitobacter sp. S74]MDF3464428.1 alpha/beta hydrolase [Sulfitobacter sp. Ks18]
MGETLFKQIHSTADALIDIVFVHGLSGDAHSTWDCGGADGFWPQWLTNDIGPCNAYCLGFGAAVFEKWAKKEMDMFERADNVLEQFAGKGLGKRPLVFVTHSLGGILAKMILRASKDADDEDWAAVSSATKLVIFLSTPHIGASIAKIVDVVPGASKHIKLLGNETGMLEDLNKAYRKFCAANADHVTKVYYEKHTTYKSVLVVSRESADPGIPGANPVAVDRDHISICKPKDRDDVVYRGIKRHIEKTQSTATASNGMMAFSVYGEKSERDRRDLLQKLIDADREGEYDYANDAQNKFARSYAKTGLFTAAKEDHDALLAEIETRFVTHVFHPHICKDAPEDDVRKALQDNVLDPLTAKGFGETKFPASAVLSGLYFLTEQCHIRWDKPA